MKSKKVIKKKALPKKKASVAPVSSHLIQNSKGFEMIDRFAEKAKDISAFKFTYAREFDILLFKNLLKIKGAKKLRIYNAINENNEHTFVITAIDDNAIIRFFNKNPKKRAQNKLVAKAMLRGDDMPADMPDEWVGNMGEECSDPKYKKGD